SKFSRKESLHERSLREAELLLSFNVEGLRLTLTRRVFPRVRMPATAVLLRIIPALKYSSTFWRQLWRLDGILDKYLGKNFLFRGACIILLAEKVS
ncbi:MAG: hypothetical protein ACPL07_04520, partial [Candidatus Bathyarchaeia archaeon]